MTAKNPFPPPWLNEERLEVLHSIYEQEQLSEVVIAALEAVDGPPVPRWKTIQEAGARLGLSRKSFAGKSRPAPAVHSIHGPELIDMEAAAEWGIRNGVPLDGSVAEFQERVNAARCEHGLGPWIIQGLARWRAA